MTELCRICSEALKHQVCKLNEMPLTDDFINLKSSKTRKSFLGDIRIYQCRSCGIVQNPKDFDEIRKSLIFNGFDSEKIISLEQFFSS